MMGRALPPGFRFHPTDIELLLYYLKRKLLGKPLNFKAIVEVQLYKFAPWDLPDKSCLRSRDKEWYFFCPRDLKYTSGLRTNRATEAGYWKTTGRDRPICHNSHIVGMKKTLVFHTGRPAAGTRTNWVMHEYKLVDKDLSDVGISLDACVLCKVFEKSGAGPKNGEQHGAPFKEEDWEEDMVDDSLVPLLLGPPSPAVTGDPNTITKNGMLNALNKVGSLLEPPCQASSDASAGKPPLSEELNVENLMAYFGVADNGKATNKEPVSLNRLGNVLSPARVNGNKIFGGLEDICTRAELQTVDTTLPANMWEKYVVGQALLGDDNNYLELNDLDKPMKNPRRAVSLNRLSNVQNPARVDGNDIFGGLEDICTRAELQTIDTPHPANMWEKYVLDQTLLGSDASYLEVNDLDQSMKDPMRAVSLNRLSNVQSPVRVDGMDILGDLEDICTRAELQRVDTPHPTNMWEKYVLDQTHLGADVSYLELNDLNQRSKAVWFI